VLDLVARKLFVAGRPLDLLIPRDSEALIDEAAFEQDEFMPYWAELWPSALALAEAVGRARPRGRVLELGCGLGIPSLVAAASGAHVLAVDWSAHAVELLARNAQRAGVPVAARHWDWTGEPAALDGPFDLVIAADVLYEERNIAPVLRALDALAGEAWVADPGRPALPAFLERAARTWTWSTDEIEPTVYRLRRASAANG
jgi:predicted nicotinamide N-methyase